FTSNARATSAMLCPLCRRRTAVCLNSFVNFLRDFILPVSPFDDSQGLTGCLKIGVHSIQSSRGVKLMHKTASSVCLPERLPRERRAGKVSEQRTSCKALRL